MNRMHQKQVGMQESDSEIDLHSSMDKTKMYRLQEDMMLEAQSMLKKIKGIHLEFNEIALSLQTI